MPLQSCPAQGTAVRLPTRQRQQLRAQLQVAPDEPVNHSGYRSKDEEDYAHKVGADEDADDAQGDSDAQRDDDGQCDHELNGRPTSGHIGKDSEVGRQRQQLLTERLAECEQQLGLRNLVRRVLVACENEVPFLLSGPATPPGISLFVGMKGLVRCSQEEPYVCRTYLGEPAEQDQVYDGEPHCQGCGYGQPYGDRLLKIFEKGGII